jgi:arylsulfatase
MKNIALISWDSVRADHLSTFGYERETTPKLSEIAEESLVFEQAFAPGSGTTSSFGSSFTGDYINATKSEKRPSFFKDILKNQDYLPELLQDEGYYTGAVHSNALLSKEYGWDRGFNEFNGNKWTKVEDKEENSESKLSWDSIKKETLLPTVQRLGIAGEAIHARNIIFKTPAYTPWEELWTEVEEFVKTAPEPWFLFILLVDTHHPWYAPPKYHEWSQPGFRKSHLLSYLMRYYYGRLGERNQSIVNAYDNELRHADGFLEAFDELLTTTDNTDTALIFHSDHGDELGEHGRYGHGAKLYDTIVHVPLLIKNVGKKGRVSAPVSNVALGNTVLDIAGSDQRIGEHHSLLSDIKQQPVIVENFIEDNRITAAAVDRNWKVIYHPESGWEAYERKLDRFEKENCFGEHPESLEIKVRKHIKKRMPEHPDNNDNKKADSDELRDVREQLTNLGYID